jgi:hypothetical protein
MSNVTVKFLPPNLTSEVKPLDQGITRSVKGRYPKMLQYIVTVVETSNTRSDFNKSIPVLHEVKQCLGANFKRNHCEVLPTIRI